MSEQESEVIAKFASLTNADEEQARFYMESTNWDLNMALANFYEDRDHDEPLQESSSGRPTAPPLVASVPQSSSSSSKKPEKTVIKSTGNVRTLSNFRQELESSDSSDNEEGQAFYAGGSEHSGQQVLGPPRARRGDIVTEMFRSVRELGAEVVEPHSSNSKGRQSFVFGGTGYRLGETANDSEVVTSKKSDSNPYYEVTLRFWKNGFSINDGPLQSYEDPKSQEILRLIQHGKIPNDIVSQAEGREINFNLEDFRHTEYVGKPTKVNKFAGTGQKLGSVTPTLTSPTPAANDSSSNSDNSVQSNPIKVDDNKPKTNIQIRLADGSRLVGTFNHDHTIGDLRSFINASSPQSRNRSYILLSSFPRKELVNDEDTIEQSGLVNAVVMQHLTV